MAGRDHNSFNWTRDGLISLAAGIFITVVAFVAAGSAPAFQSALAPGIVFTIHVWPAGIMGGEAFVLGLVVDSILYGLGIIVLVWFVRRVSRGGTQGG